MESEKLLLIAQCAESCIYLNPKYTIPDQNKTQKAILKVRKPKKYRIPAIEEMITKSRIKKETNNLRKAAKLGVNVPKVLHVDFKNKTIYLEYLENCKTLKISMTDIAGKIDVKSRTTTRNEKTGSTTALEQVFFEAGKAVAIMHSKGLIHGDLTSSNVMIRDSDLAVFFIDFGLSNIRYG